MSWLRTAFTICLPEPGTYYAVTHPIDFYEWTYTGSAPKGTKLHTHLPPSDAFTSGDLVVAIAISPQSVVSISGEPQLSHDAPVDITLKIGSAPSAKELLSSYYRLVERFSRGMHNFKKHIQTRVYIGSPGKKPHLFKLSHFDEKNITLHNFGPINELTGKLAEVREKLSQDSMRKKGRSLELEEFRRYENAMTFMNSSHLFVDAAKMDQLIKSSNTEAQQTVTMPWTECYERLDADAQILKDKIKKFESAKWVRDALNTGISVK